MKNQKGKFWKNAVRTFTSKPKGESKSYYDKMEDIYSLDEKEAVDEIVEFLSRNDK